MKTKNKRTLKQLGLAVILLGGLIAGYCKWVHKDTFNPIIEHSEIK